MFGLVIAMHWCYFTKHAQRKSCQQIAQIAFSTRAGWLTKQGPTRRGLKLGNSAESTSTISSFCSFLISALIGNHQRKQADRASAKRGKLDIYASALLQLHWEEPQKRMNYYRANELAGSSSAQFVQPR